MTFEQIEETFILVWKSMQDFVLMDSKEENERLKRTGILLEKGKAKRLKTGDGLAQEQQTEDDKKKESEDQDKIINLQQWVVLVRQESSVDITPSGVKASICDWKIFKDRLRELYQVFRVGHVPKVYLYFETMLKDFDREDVVTLWKLVKDRFKEELPKSDLEKCLFWPLKVMFEPVATDGIWQFEAPIKSLKLFRSCNVHCLKMEGMIVYMLNDVEYPLQKSTLQKMLDHKCEVNSFQHTCSFQHTAREDSLVEVAALPPKSKSKPTRGTRGCQKRMVQNEDAPRQTSWTNEEEIVLCKCLIHVSENSKKGNARKDVEFWTEVLQYFESKTKASIRRVYDMINWKWKTVRLYVAWFCRTYANVMRRAQDSGAGDEDYYNRALLDYEAEHGMQFTLLHCWEVLKGSPK
ncbi:hypothetical protein Tco_0508135 [Tanacetum coccineum]